jgi:amino acid transporter
MEYVLSNAAVARSFTSYAASAYGVLHADAWRVHVDGLASGYDRIDLVAVSVVLLLTVCLCCSTQKSSMFNLVMTVLHIAFIFFIIIAGFVKGDTKNLVQAGDPAANPSGFAPLGIRGIFNGAAIVYFSYIGFDAVSTTAEEVKNPARNMPIGVSGSVILVTVLYSLIAVALCMLQPYDMVRIPFAITTLCSHMLCELAFVGLDMGSGSKSGCAYMQIDTGAPFSTAFQHVVGWEWATNFIGAGASLGIMTSLLVAMLGQARYLCVLGRANIVPRWFAAVNSTTGTPVNATVFLGEFLVF